MIEHLFVKNHPKIEINFHNFFKSTFVLHMSIFEKVGESLAILHVQLMTLFYLSGNFIHTIFMSFFKISALVGSKYSDLNGHWNVFFMKPLFPDF